VSPSRPIQFALLDLDDTLYASQCGLWAAIGERIDRYMVERLGMTAGTTMAQRKHYLETYGTTLNGLRREYAVDADDFLRFVHDVPLPRYLSANSALDAMLTRLPLTKVIFTNADAAHAQRVLDCLGIARHFEHIIDIHALAFINKPDVRAYERALALLGARPDQCVFVDDAARNLQPAHQLGLLTVLVRPEASAPLPEGVDYQIEAIMGLEGVLAQVWGVTAGGGQA
jgi:putative hydrolase of the HAD superfamily